MNDYNRGALPDPCLRLDYGFGKEWASVELGDGTGYVRLADYEKAVAENEKLQKLVRDMWPIARSGVCIDRCAYYDECIRQYDERGCILKQCMRELGIGVEPHVND